MNAPAEEVVLADLGGEQEVLKGAEANAHVEGSCGLFLHRHRGGDRVLLRAALVGDFDRLEVAQRHDALLGHPQARAAEQLALVDAQLAANHLVAGGEVAHEVDALNRDLVPLLNVEGQVNDARLRVDGGERREIDVGVAVVVIISVLEMIRMDRSDGRIFIREFYLRLNVFNFKKT